jgi:hypothetical protein
MIAQLRSRSTALAERVAIGISLLKAPSFAPEAQRALRKLCTKRLDPATFAKISKALTRAEADTPQKVKRERDRAGATDRWTKLIAEYHANPDGPTK